VNGDCENPEGVSRGGCGGEIDDKCEVCYPYAGEGPSCLRLTCVNTVSGDCELEVTVTADESMLVLSLLFVCVCVCVCCVVLCCVVLCVCVCVVYLCCVCVCVCVVQGSF